MAVGGDGQEPCLTSLQPLGPRLNLGWKPVWPMNSLQFSGSMLSNWLEMGPSPPHFPSSEHTASG